MCRVILCVAAGALVAAAVRPATADDTFVCTHGASDEAIGARTLVLALNPKFAGMAYGCNGDNGRCHPRLRRVIRLDPKFALAHSNRGEATMPTTIQTMRSLTSTKR